LTEAKYKTKENKSKFENLEKQVQESGWHISESGVLQSGPANAEISKLSEKLNKREMEIMNLSNKLQHAQSTAHPDMSNTFNQLLAEQKHASQLESRLEVTEDKNLELKHQLHSLNDNLTFALDEKDRLIEKNSNLKKSIANMESTVNSTSKTRKTRPV